MKYRLTYREAENLAKETVRQMNLSGYKGINAEPLIRAALTADIRHSGTRRRQYPISKSEEYTQTIEGPDERVCLLKPRRVVSTSPDAQPRNLLERTVIVFEDFGKTIEEFVAQYRNKGFDSENTVRNLRREQIGKRLLQKAHEHSVPYALMGTIINTSREDEKTEKEHKKAKTPEIHIRHPWIAIPDPAITEEEIYELSEFCKQFQIPSQAWLMNHIYMR